MSRFSTFRVGGPAEALLFAEDPENLKRLILWLQENEIPWRVIGRGSNILVADQGLPGVVVILGRGFSFIEQVKAADGPGDILIRAGAGCSLARLIQYCTTIGLRGLEFAIGIPGSVGGGIAMNAGAWGGDMAGVVRSVELLDFDGSCHDLQQRELDFTYRHCGRCRRSVVLAATFGLERGKPEEITAACQEYLRQRRERQPLGAASAGSIFKNPPGQAAGRLIEEAGLKGHRVGGAEVSTRHANFIINTGTATAHDIIDLIRLVQSRVFSRSNVMLQPEVKILGLEEK